MRYWFNNRKKKKQKNKKTKKKWIYDGSQVKSSNNIGTVNPLHIGPKAIGWP